MRKQSISLFLACLLGALSWASAQATKTELFDLKRSQQELEIMRGILSTTLSFVVRELRAKEPEKVPQESLLRARWSVSNLSGYYLYGQGAVFVLPVSSFRYLLGAKSIFEPWAQEMEAMEAVLATEAAHAELMAVSPAPPVGGVPGGVVGGVLGGVVGGVAGGVAPPSPAVAPSPTPRPGTSSRPARASSRTEQQSPEALRKKLLEAQEKVKSRRSETEEKRSKFLEQLEEIKVFLIEALANHGDSLTHVKASEYITLILTGSEGELPFENTLGGRSYREVISVQKSAITEYKTGKLDLEGFKKRVLIYYN